MRGPEAVIGMIAEARRITGGTLRLVAREVVANGEHAVALVGWAAERGGAKIEGKEVAVYRVRGGKVVEANFHQNDSSAKERFWE